MLIGKVKIVDNSAFSEVGKYGMCATSTGNNNQIFLSFTVSKNAS